MGYSGRHSKGAGHGRTPAHRKTATTRSGNHTLRLVLVAALALIVVIGAVVIIRGCGRNGSASEGGTVASYVSPYDFSGLAETDGRFTYTENGVVCSKTGIDVSEHEGDIDWNAVAADGIEFAIIRLGNRGTTEGGLYLDENYRANVAGAGAAGIPIGVYFFSQALTEDEAREEAQYVLDNLGDAKLDYPIVFDEEITGTDSRAAHLTQAQLTANALAFCDLIRQAGYDCMIYGNKYDIARFDLESLQGIPVWYAQYDAAEPQGQFDFIMWQYTESGSVKGISQAVDLDLYFTTGPS